MPRFDAASEIMLPEGYVEVAFRTRGTDGKTIRLSPTLPVDEAMETTAEVLKNFRDGNAEKGTSVTP